MNPGMRKIRSLGRIVTTLAEMTRPVEESPGLILPGSIYFAASIESMWTLFLSASVVAETVTWSP